MEVRTDEGSRSIPHDLSRPFQLRNSAGPRATHSAADTAAHLRHIQVAVAVLEGRQADHPAVEAVVVRRLAQHDLREPLKQLRHLPCARPPPLLTGGVLHSAICRKFHLRCCEEKIRAWQPHCRGCCQAYRWQSAVAPTLRTTHGPAGQVPGNRPRINPVQDANRWRLVTARGDVCDKCRACKKGLLSPSVT